MMTVKCNVIHTCNLTDNKFLKEMENLPHYQLIKIVIWIKWWWQTFKKNACDFSSIKLFTVLEITPSVKTLHVKEINLFSDVFPRGKMNRLAIFESLQSCNSNGVFITIRWSKHRGLISTLMTALNYNECVSPWANDRQCNQLIMWSFISLLVITAQPFACCYIKVKIFCSMFSFFKFITRSLGAADCTFNWEANVTGQIFCVIAAKWRYFWMWVFYYFICWVFIQQFILTEHELWTL